ncbi:MAG: Na/Pi cotransporter family protein [Oscillospiraceae bacterium]|nr:Na/Pi cotransporter family protein [Oscillospiraceae bacterium]
MDLFDVLSMIGGLAMFLYGMTVMGEGLEQSAGNKLKSILESLTSNPVKGFIMGLVVTAVIQSSSATTVMVVGFVNSGIMTLRQAINIIMGANVGTTITSWILSLAGIESGNIFIKLLKPSSFTPVLGLIGVVFYVFMKNSKRRDLGQILLGFLVLMSGMDIMSGAVAGLKDVPEFTNILLMFQNPVLGVLAGALLTAAVQSSSASVGILQALSVTGAITFGSAIPIVMGQNIGTTVTAMISSIGTNRNARRAALVHLYFNVVGTVICLVGFTAINAVFQFAFVDLPIDRTGIAIVHTAFNLICTAVMLPLAGMLEKLAYMTVPKEHTPQEKSLLDERLMVTPSVALEQAKRVSVEMAKRTQEAYSKAMGLLTVWSEEDAEFIRKVEDEVDVFEDALGTYLVKLSAKNLSADDSVELNVLLHTFSDIERISDHAKSILMSAQNLHQNEKLFSADAQHELGVVSAAVVEVLNLAIEAFSHLDLAAASRVEPLEQNVDRLCNKIRERHIMRLREGNCTQRQGMIFTDILSDLSRISDHCSNIAVSAIENNKATFDTHRYLNEIKTYDEDFRRYYEEYAAKYTLQS